MLTENITGNLDLSDAAVCPQGRNHSRGRGIAEVLQTQTEDSQCQQDMGGETEGTKTRKADRKKKIIYKKIDGSQADNNSSFL